MERNDASGDLGGSNGAADAADFSNTGSQQSNNFDFSGSTGSTDPHGIRDRAKGAIGSAGEKLSNAGSTVRERAGAAKDKLADVLESGADRLRSKSGGAALAGATAGATADASISIPADGKVAQVSERVAGGMQASADWLRDADIEGLKTGIERQVKEHPGRTLLIAAGLGYLMARAFRGDK